MENKINACTLASDVQFHFTLVSISSFVETNRWFEGTISLFISPAFPLSDLNFNKLKLIYPNLEKVVMNGAPNNAVEAMKQSALLLQRISDYARIFAFSLEQENLLYFANTCLFMREITPILNDSLVSFTPEKSLIYIGSKNLVYSNFLRTAKINSAVDTSFLENDATKIDSIVLSANEVKDSKFIQLKERVNKARCIYYNAASLSDAQYKKIKQVWLHANNLINQKLASPRNFNAAKINSNGNHTNPNNPFNKGSEVKRVTEAKIVHTAASSSNLITTSELKNYLNNKKIAIVANSSELLNYSYGDLIDSHDVVFRFNGYVISPTHTGSKTQVHCIFREARFNLNLPSEYLLVFSKPIFPWKNAVADLTAKYPSKNTVNYNFPSDVDVSSRFGKVTIPTSGLCSVILIESLNLPKYELTLFGFNGYSGGTSSILRSNDSTAISTVHDYNIEMQYLQREFNQILPAVLQKSKL